MPAASVHTHTRRVSPISRFAANRETGDFPIPDSRFPIPANSESGIGDSLEEPRFPTKSISGELQVERELEISGSDQATSGSQATHSNGTSTRP